MNLHFVIYVVSVVYLNSIDCHLLSKKHVTRRQIQEMYQNQNQMPQASYQPEPFNPGRPADLKTNSFPEKAIFPPKIPDFSTKNPVSQPGYGGLASEIFAPKSSGLPPGNLAQGQVGNAAGNVEQGQVEAIGNAGLAPKNTLPNNSGSATGNLAESNSGLAAGNAPPEFTGFPSMNNARLAPENALPNNAGSVPENALPNNAGSVPENAMLYNAGLATGNVAASNSELTAGNASPEFIEFLSMNNAGSASENALPNNVVSAPENALPNNTGSAPKNILPNNAGLANGDVPSESVVFPSRNATSPSDNFWNSNSVEFSPLPYSLISVATINQHFPSPSSLQYSVANASLIPTSQAFSNLNSNIKSNRINLKRQKRNASYKNYELDELLETGKRLFGDSTSSNKRNEKHHLNFFDDDVEKELKANNATLIPIPEGVQINTAAKKDNKKINSVVKIITSTQRTIVFDNTTEIENVLEMQMEKNIEDDKGANKGSEEVRIIETERVKPIVNKKWNDLALQIRKRSYNNRFLTYRRSKRSVKFPSERPRSNFVFDKMARRLKKRNSFSNRQAAMNFKAVGRRISDSPTRDEPVPDKTEIDDFVKLFLKQLRKYRKSQRKKNDTAWLKELRSVEFRNDTKHSTRKSKTMKKNFELIKQVNVVMNVDLTWNTIVKDSVKTRNATKNQNQLMTNVETPVPAKTSTHPIPQTLVYLGDRNDSGLRTTLLVLVIALLSAFMVWFIREKMRKLSDLNSKSKTFYYKGKDDKFKGLKYTRIGDVCLDDYPQLEWQSENGDWLTDYK